MKKIVTIMLVAFVSFATFAQKDEIKAAEKALKKLDYATAKAAIVQAEGLIGNTDDKTKAKFYYLKGEIFAGLSKTDPSTINFETSATAFQNLGEIENGMGSSKYSDLSAITMQDLNNSLRTKGSESYQNKDFKAAMDELYLAYTINKADTVLLEYVANAAYLAKETEQSLIYFNQLKDMGYSGITTIYSVRNVDTGVRENVASKGQMDLMTKTKDYDDPQATSTESKKPTIIKNIASIYMEQGENEKAIEAFNEARKLSPNDVNLIQNEAVLHYKLGDKDAYVSLISEAIKLEPNNATLYFNLGVISGEQGDIEKSKEYYRKAIELKSDYKDAYVNLGSAVLVKDKALVEEMNENLSNFDKYDQIKAKQVDLYKEVIPLYVKAYEIDPTDLDTIRTLMSLYENVEMENEYKELRVVYDGLKE